MAEYIVCTKCGGQMERFAADGRDLSNEANPMCPVCRGVPGAVPLVRKRDVLGGFAWKRDANGKKVPK
jgi:hypothetical protein